jgi:hypothetical protein
VSTVIGENLVNPVTGERGVVRIVPDESNGHLLVADLYVRPDGAVTGRHNPQGWRPAPLLTL